MNFTVSKKALYFISIIVFGKLIADTQGYCNEITVKDAEYQGAIDGSYYLMYSYLCNGQPVWIQTYTVNGVIVTSYYYIWYAVNIPTLLNLTTVTATSGWVIGPSLCSNVNTPLEIAAYNLQPMNTVPNSLPSTWYEYTGSQYVQDSDLEVNCDDDLDGWEIFGIVIGSICGVVILMSILACCCAKCKEKKRRTNPAAVVYSTGARGARAGACTVVTTAAPMGQPAPYTQPVYIINPPAYDNNLPPAYDTINETQPVAQAAATSGVINDGYGNKF